MIDAAGIDQRWNTRQPLQLNIQVFDSIYAQEAILNTRTENVSLGGMFILTPAQQLAVNHNLAIGLPLGNKVDSTQQRLSARVVRKTQRGVGLSFNDNNLDTLQILRELLYDQNSPY
jgi:hypothetical protein